MLTAPFNPLGDPLWVTIEMNGLYYMSYVYRFWGVANDPHAVLTNPVKANNNKIAIDDYYKIENNYVQNEPIAKHNGRIVDVDLDIIRLQDDNGYSVTVAIWQADNNTMADVMQSIINGTPLAHVPAATDTRAGKLGSNASGNEKFWFELTDITQ